MKMKIRAATTAVMQQEERAPGGGMIAQMYTVCCCCCCCCCCSSTCGKMNVAAHVEQAAAANRSYSRRKSFLQRKKKCNSFFQCRQRQTKNGSTNNSFERTWTLDMKQRECYYSRSLLSSLFVVACCFAVLMTIVFRSSLIALLLVVRNPFF
jgi:hypothetical protein